MSPSLRFLLFRVQIKQAASHSMIQLKTITSNGDTNSYSVCIKKYHGEHCVSALQPLGVCSGSLDKTNVFISNNVDPNLAKKEVGDLLFALDLFIKPTDECNCWLWLDSHLCLTALLSVMRDLNVIMVDPAKILHCES